MKGQMKRILGLKGWAMLLAGAFVLGSCVEDEVLENQDNLTPKKSISFNAVVDWAEDHIEGRGAVLTQANLTSFNVWATLTKAENLGGTTINYFSGVAYNKDATTGVYSSTANYYWPGEGPILDFIAVGNDPNFTPGQAYTVPTAATSQKDVVVATASAPGTGYNNNYQPVPLDFQHIMSAVTVSIGTGMGVGTINSVTFKGIKNKGTYNVASPTWTTANDATTPDYPVTFVDNATTYAVSSTPTANTIITDDEATLMLLPQTFTNDAQIVVNFTPTGGTAQDFTASLKDQLTGWTMGKAYNYVLNINPSLGLDLDIIVDEWTNPGPIYSDYGNTTAVGEDGKINWIKNIDGDSENELNYTQTTDGTQNIVKLENTTGKKQAAFTFEIAAPLGGTWYALLETISGNSQAFTLSLLDDDGNQLKNDNGELLPCQGNVGTPGKVMVEVNGPNPYESGTNNKARLYFVVRLGGGQVLAVPGTELGEYFIQQDFEQKQQ